MGKVLQKRKLLVKEYPKTMRLPCAMFRLVWYTRSGYLQRVEVAREQGG